MRRRASFRTSPVTPRASTVEVSVAVGDALVVRVDDDGVGLPAPSAEGTGGLGLGNLSRRAVRRGGEFRFSARPGGGARAEWTVPNPA